MTSRLSDKVRGNSWKLLLLAISCRIDTLVAGIGGAILGPDSEQQGKLAPRGLDRPWGGDFEGRVRFVAEP